MTGNGAARHQGVANWIVRLSDLILGPPDRRIPPWQLCLGYAFAELSLIMSLLLAIDHLGALQLPGCGPGGACQQAAESIWGKIPLGSYQWPVSYLGLAYFAGLLAGWSVARGQLTRSVRYLVRLGAAASGFFCVIILLKWLVCPYCIAAHLGNFAFWLTVELTRSRAARARPVWGALMSVFAATSVVLGLVDRHVQAAREARAESQRAASVERIVRRTQAPPLATARATDTAPSEPPASVTVSTSAPGADPQPAPGPFTGRYRRGPAQARIRIVMFTDFQCHDCRRIEEQIRQILAERDDVSVSVKHFPFNEECNPYVRGQMHPNACWAARAAEAAGILWGAEGFWKMHDWLFEHQGAFSTAAELEEAIRSFGYSPGTFLEVMQGTETLQRVQADIQEGNELGLFFTPMIFINGVELKGWYGRDALRRTIADLTAQDLPVRGPEQDRPPLALEKYIADWREQPVRTLPPDADPWWLGAEQAELEIVMWGDYQEPFTAEADNIVRAFIARNPQARYSFRHYPFNRDCNPNVNTTRHPQACRAAQAAEAAGILGGATTYWKMHVWLMENREQVNDQTIVEAAARLGLNADEFARTLDSSAVRTHIADDIRAAHMLPALRYGVGPGLPGIPTIFINGKYVPRWRMGPQTVLNAILQAAAEP
mgnify:CR=1 FL=1